MVRLRSKRWVLLCAAVVVCVRPTSAPAQARVEFTPFFGGYVPLARLIDSTAIDTIRVWQGNAPMFGANLRFRMSSTVNVEGGFAFARSGRFIERPSGLQFGELLNFQQGWILIPSARMVWNPRRSNFYGMVGAALVMRRGAAYPSTLDGREDLAANLGFGVRAEVTPSLSLQVDAEVYLYVADPDGDIQNSLFPSSFQQDIVVRVGIPIGFFHR